MSYAFLLLKFITIFIIDTSKVLKLIKNSKSPQTLNNDFKAEIIYFFELLEIHER